MRPVNVLEANDRVGSIPTYSTIEKDTFDMTSISKPSGKGNGFTWEEPDTSLLEDRRGALPPFPTDIFSPGLANWLARASRGAGTAVDHVAIPMIGVASSLIGKARRIQATTSWVEPLTMWVAVIGESGSRKTPGLRVILRTLDQIEEENKPNHHNASVNHLIRVEAAKVAAKSWKKACADAIAAKRDPPPMPIEAVDPGDFIHPSLSVTDCTVPRLARLCEVRPRGMMQIRDELASLFTTMKLTGSRSFYLECWNGNKFTVERVADDRCFTVDNLLVGIIGGFQPDKLARSFAGDQDGLHSRFLYGWPATPDYRPLTNDIAEVDPEFKDLLTRLIRLPDEDENGKFTPRTVQLSAEALQEFEHYRRFVDREKRGAEGYAQQWLSKSETHALRLAGTLAFLAWAETSAGAGIASPDFYEPVEIDQRFMADAIRLTREYFWPHAKAALRQIGLSDRHRHARRVLRWCRVNDRYEVSLQSIRRDALGCSIDVEQARDLADRLVMAGWLRAEPIVQTGGRPRERWAVNPRLFETAGSAESAESHFEADLSAVSAVSASAKTTKRRPV